MFLPDGCKLGNKSLNPILQDLIGEIGYTYRKEKMRKNAVMIYIFYNYVSSNLLNIPLLFLLL